MCINQFPATPKKSSTVENKHTQKKNLFPQTQAWKIFWMMLLYLQAKSCVEIEFEFSDTWLEYSIQFGWYFQSIFGWLLIFQSGQLKISWSVSPFYYSQFVRDAYFKNWYQTGSSLLIQQKLFWRGRCWVVESQCYNVPKYTRNKLDYSWKPQKCC